jgi:hypothetical protein
MLLLLCAFMTLDQVYINWFLTLQQVKQGGALSCPLQRICRASPLLHSLLFTLLDDHACSCCPAKSCTFCGSGSKGVNHFYSSPTRTPHALNIYLARAHCSQKFNFPAIR